MQETSDTMVIMAFTEDQANRLTGVSLYQLRSWARDGFFIPSLTSRDEDEPLLSLYSFRDLVCLKIINQLRNESRVPLNHLREVKEKLSHLGDDLWAKTTLFVLNRRVILSNPETGEKEDAVNGQGVLQIPLVVVSGNMKDAVRLLRQRDQSLIGRIDAKRFGAKNPVIAGTRIPVSTIKDFIDDGFTPEQIVLQYPSLTVDDVKAAMGHKVAA
ncbi:MAG TPA: hypothetical protein DCL54_17370 [Alphaproteobacteria bacterium]|nr:hypothetical protein [Alphaproteobacteria bacterium]HAJ48348.1 hypothetical protein [Alphaproteobacteria bacterium]